jgi:hypothetical protein
MNDLPRSLKWLTRLVRGLVLLALVMYVVSLLSG